jgi:hypothetical protein
MPENMPEKEHMPENMPESEGCRKPTHAGEHAAPQHMPENMPESEGCRMATHAGASAGIRRMPELPHMPEHPAQAKVSPRTAAAPSGAGLGRIAPSSRLQQFTPLSIIDLIRRY